MRSPGVNRAVAVCCAAALLAAFGCRTSRDGRSAQPLPPRISVAEEDGVWWFTSGDETGFFALGANLAEPPEDVDAEPWVDQTIVDLRSDGFNTVSPGRTIPVGLLKGRIRFIAWPIHPSGPPILEALERPDEHLPDLFSQVVFGHARWVARVIGAYGWSSADLLGQVGGDSPTWIEPADGSMHPWVEAIRRSDEESPAKRRWTGLLRSRYGAAGDAGSAYGVDARNWEEIARQTEWPEAADEEAVREDTRIFLRLLAERWYEVRSGLMEQYDDGFHLFFSDRISGSALPAWLYPILAEWTDVIYVAWIDGAPGREEKLREIHEATGKPILVESPAATGEAYARDLDSLTALPFVVGRLQHGALPDDSDLVKAANSRAEATHSSSRRRLP